MSGQLYSKEDLGKSKTQAMLDMAHKYSSYYRTSAFREPFTSMSSATSIMICGFDNMEARKVFFNSWRNYVELRPDSEQKHCLFIDGRLAAEEFQVFCIRGDDKYNIKNRYFDEGNLDWQVDDILADKELEQFDWFEIPSDIYDYVEV